MTFTELADMQFPKEHPPLISCTEQEIERQVAAESDSWAGIDPVCMDHNAETWGDCHAHGGRAEICEKCDLCDDCQRLNHREYDEAVYWHEKDGLRISKRFVVIE